MVGNAMIRENKEAKGFDVEAISHDDYAYLGKVVSGRFLLSTKGLQSLFKSQPFREIRFYCHKDYHNRRLHLKTNGTEVVDWLIKRKSWSPKPRACGSFSRLTNDTSYLGGSCMRWDSSVWNNNDIYDAAMWAWDIGSDLYYTTSLDYSQNKCP